jgi:hypothetical protein
VILRSLLPADGKRRVLTPVGSSDIYVFRQDVKFGFWRGSCDQMFESLENFSQKLLNHIKTLRHHRDDTTAGIISSSCIACLAHLAILYELVGRTDPATKAEMDGCCDSALQRLGTVSSELHVGEYTYLDLLLGVRPNFSYALAGLPYARYRIGLLGEIDNGFRYSHRVASSRRECVVAMLPEDYWRPVY